MGRRNFHLSRRTSAIVISAAALAIGIAIPTASYADNASGCDFAAAGTTQSCSAPLAGSTFAGGDGNLLASPGTFGSTDWSNVAGLSAGFDKPSGSGDNSFGQGTKEDNPNVTVVTGSIPNNKSDLTRFYEASEIGSNGDNFLYLGWERNNVLGTANMDFEINQNTTPGFTGSATGPVTLARAAGDLLVTFDFTNGGGKPALGLLTWLTAAAGNTAGQCFSSNSLPCWGNQVTLNGTDSIGAVNNLDPVGDPLFPSSANYLNPVPALQFGETAIDLTKANVFPPGTCKAFGSAFVKSRASASFTAEVKDFIAPIPVNISNCGSIQIIKHTSPRGQNQVFSYTSNLPAESPGTVDNIAQGGVACPGNTVAGIQAGGSFCLNDTGNSGPDSAGNTVYTGDTLQAGTYHVTEGNEPSGFTFGSLTCTGGTVTKSGTTANITLAAGDHVVCTYVNQQNTAALSTNVSPGPVFPGVAVHDTATVTGSNAALTPGGTVTFFLCGPIPTGSCDGTTNAGHGIGTGTLTGSGGTASANSPDVNTTASALAPGRYCFRATWPGDSNYPGALTEFGGANGTNECFTVEQISTTTTTTPSVGSGQSTTFGATVTDHAIVQATRSGDGTPTGTVTFFVCNPAQVSGGTCPDGSGTQVGSAVTATAVANSDPPASSADSASVTANQIGTWCFRAVYAPDTPTYTGSEDASANECFTVTDSTVTTSAQNWLPNDSATVAPTGGAPLNGTLTIQLYTDNACGAAGGSAVSGQQYQKTLKDATSIADRTLTTSNTTYLVSQSTGVSWKVTFHSSDGNVSDSSTCESTNLTISN
jgi:hypothetical protein